MAYVYSSFGEKSRIRIIERFPMRSDSQYVFLCLSITNTATIKPG